MQFQLVKLKATACANVYGYQEIPIKVLALNFDISDQISKGIETYLGKMLFQYLITVCDDADKNCPTVWPGVITRMHWSFEDPARLEGAEEQKLAKFREVRDLMEKKIKEWVAEQHAVLER